MPHTRELVCVRQLKKMYRLLADVSGKKWTLLEIKFTPNGCQMTAKSDSKNLEGSLCEKNNSDDTGKTIEGWVPAGLLWLD